MTSADHRVDIDRYAEVQDWPESLGCATAAQEEPHSGLHTSITGQGEGYTQLEEVREPAAMLVPATTGDVVSEVVPELALGNESTDIDWHTSDPSQRDIPIRKRGRNRKAIQSSLSVKTASKPEEIAVPSTTCVPENVTPTDLETIAVNKQPITGEKAERYLSGSVKDRLKRRSSTSEGYAGSQEMTKGRGDPDANLDMEPGLCSNTGVDRQSEVGLPDPLVTGTLDEEELKKSDQQLTIKPAATASAVSVASKSATSASASTTVAKPLVSKSLSVHPATKSTSQQVPHTRFRKRPNVSMLEAAEQKKAKSNDTSALYSSNTVTPKAKYKNRKSSGKGKGHDEELCNKDKDNAKKTSSLENTETLDTQTSDLVKTRRPKPGSSEVLDVPGGRGRTEMETICETDLDLESSKCPSNTGSTHGISPHNKARNR